MNHRLSVVCSIGERTLIVLTKKGRTLAIRQPLLKVDKKQKITPSKAGNIGVDDPSGGKKKERKEERKVENGERRKRGEPFQRQRCLQEGKTFKLGSENGGNGRK